MKDEAKRGLRPYIYKDNDVVADSTQPWPAFSELVLYVYSAFQSRTEAAKKTPGIKSPTRIHSGEYFQETTPLIFLSGPSPLSTSVPVGVYEETLAFLREVLQHSAPSRAEVAAWVAAQLQKVTNDCSHSSLPLPLNEVYRKGPTRTQRRPH